MERIEQLNLPFFMDTPTSRKGNCFFAALMQQFARPELQLSGIYNDHITLRRCICNFALTNNFEFMVTVKDLYNIVAVAKGKQTWEIFFDAVRKTGMWAENGVVRCAAWLLERDIFVVSQQCTIANPYLMISGRRVDGSVVVHPPPNNTGECSWRPLSVVTSP